MECEGLAILYESTELVEKNINSICPLKLIHHVSEYARYRMACVLDVSVQ